MRIFCLFMVAALASACSPAARAPRFDAGVVASGRSYVLTGGEIQRISHGSNLLDAVRSLRPSWLIARGVDRTSMPRVYLNDLELINGVSDLATIHAAMVEEIRFLTPAEATMRYGTGNGHGAIAITSLRQRW